MSDHEFVGSGQRRERGDSDADVPFLYFGVWFLASFEQGVAAQCSDDLHVGRETVKLSIVALAVRDRSGPALARESGIPGVRTAEPYRSARSN